MKKATFYGIGGTTIFYLAMGCTGYAAFGNDMPGNILSGFGSYGPSWVVDIANICIILHLLGAYQVSLQSSKNKLLKKKRKKLNCRISEILKANYIFVKLDLRTTYLCCR